MTEPTKFSLAPNPIFWTIQGEGHLRGFQMCFVRLAGCSVGCDGCDTNYAKASTATAQEISVEVYQAIPHKKNDQWIWITGGEPADVPQMKMRELLQEFSKFGWRIAIATSGVKAFIPPVDWLSVSPHSAKKLAQPYGNEIKLVPGLNGFDPDEFLATNPETDFMYRYVQPLSVGNIEDPESLKWCLDWLKTHPNWSLSRQDHHYWGVK